jgi:tRNA-Thr(GGU) m(6)t(6)A37 methyltransferase TsaA
MKTHSCPVIGCIRTPFESKENCPVQPALSGKAAGRVEVLAEYAPALQDIEGFSHLILLYQMDKAGEVILVRPTFFDKHPHGIFASRHPCRPSGIGLSVVRLRAVEGNVLLIEGIDVLDNTPLLDIKPYLPQYDCYPEASQGWTENVSSREKTMGRE